MTVRLNSINNSNTNNSDFVIFQRNAGTSPDPLAIAWQAIRPPMPGHSHPFTYPMDFKVGTRINSGEFTSQESIPEDSSFEIVKTEDGSYRLHLNNTQKPIQPLNPSLQFLSRGNSEVGNAVSSQKKAKLATSEPVISFAVASMTEDEQLKTEGVPLEIHADISLADIASADIVMTGGFDGEQFTPYKFELQNVVKR